MVATARTRSPVHLLLTGRAFSWFFAERGRRGEYEDRVPRDRGWSGEYPAPRYEGPERRRPEHQHHRADDAEIRINTKKVAAVVGLVLSVVTLAGIVAAFLGATIATQRELDAVTDSLTAFKRETREMHRHLDNDNSRAAAERALLPSSVRLQCLQLQRWNSMTLADAAGLPCDSLLQRRERR